MCATTANDYGLSSRHKPASALRVFSADNSLQLPDLLRLNRKTLLPRPVLFMFHLHFLRTHIHLESARRDPQLFAINEHLRFERIPFRVSGLQIRIISGSRA